MNNNFLEAQDVFLSKLNQICNKFGLNNIMAQLYAVLYLSDKAMSLTDMAERLKISKATTSISMRALERYGAAKRVWVKGSRRDYYEAEEDIYKVILDRVKSMSKSRLSEINDMIETSRSTLSSANSLDEEDKKSMERFKQRLNELKGFQRKAQSLFTLFNKSGLL